MGKLALRPSHLANKKRLHKLFSSSQAAAASLILDDGWDDEPEGTVPWVTQ